MDMLEQSMHNQIMKSQKKDKIFGFATQYVYTNP
jgi:hypothetical protein